MRCWIRNSGGGVLAALLLFAPGSAQASRVIPAWARKYNANCSMCHSPAVPRLNARGIQFKWAGYRMPEEIGENAEVSRLQDYFAARTRVQYAYDKPADGPATRNTFSIEGLSVFAGGAVGRIFGGLLEIDRAADGKWRPSLQHPPYGGASVALVAFALDRATCCSWVAGSRASIDPSVSRARCHSGATIPLSPSTWVETSRGPKRSMSLAPIASAYNS
jgi:hypothetical protein